MGLEFELSEKDNGCTGFRGELMLSLEEVGKIQRYLQEKSGNYGFELSPEPKGDLNKKNLKKKSLNNNNNNLNTQLGEKRKSRSSRPSYSRELKALLEDGLNILEPRSEMKGVNNQSSIGSRVVNDDFQKRLPDWVKRFHRILKIVSQQELFAPFVSCVNIKNFHLYIQGLGLDNKTGNELGESNKLEFDDNYLENKQKEINELFNNTKLYLKYLDDCGPIKPISLNSIIKKLENNEYSSSASVFSDIYSIWICAFRSQEPGGLLWTKAMDASLNFNLKLLNEPLQDDFSLTFPGSKVNSKGSRTGDISTSEPPKKLQNMGKGISTFVEENNKDLNSTISNRNRKNTGQTVQQNINSRSKNSKKNNNQSLSLSGSKIITESERREFQSLLSQLSQNDHVELFNSFLSTAYWKEVNSGEVELDDQQTPPNVFREMTRWCKIKLNIPILEEINSKDSILSKVSGKKSRQSKYPSNIPSHKKKTQLSAKQFFSSGRAFSSPSSASEDEDDISSCGNLQISQQWASTSSSGESDNEPELTSFYPHFNSK